MSMNKNTSFDERPIQSITEETPSKSIMNVMPVPLALSQTKSNSED